MKIKLFFLNLLIMIVVYEGVYSPVLAASKNSASDEPIEITADALEVFRVENKAIFTGKVEAVQSDMRLHSDVMTVFYKKNKESSQTEDTTGVNSAIERIKAKGNVFLSTPEETAQGKFGDYDLEKKIVKLNDNVVLTKGKNVVKGDFFIYNLDTGHSKVWSKVVSEGVESSLKSKEKQRVRSVFLPKSDQKDKR